jgi:hypothetical protein
MDKSVLFKADRESIKPDVFIQVDANVIGFAAFNARHTAPWQRRATLWRDAGYIVRDGNTSALDVKDSLTISSQTLQ